MSNWIDKFKKLVIPSHKKHILIADIDNLFEYEELGHAFESDGYTIQIAKTDLEGRLQFELFNRDTEKLLLVVPVSYYPLPDIEMQVHYQAIGLYQLFPNLDSKAIKGLSYNALCLLSKIKVYEKLGYEKTVHFLLENLYNIDFSTLISGNAKEKVLNALISVMLEKNGVNLQLKQFLSDFAKPYFPSLVEKSLNKANLIDFIQEQWDGFVNYGDSILNFKDSTLTKSIGFLFAFGYLQPIKVTDERYEDFYRPFKIGLYVDNQESNDNELVGLIEYLGQEVEVIEDVADQWFNIIQVLSKAKLKYLQTNNFQLKDNYSQIEDQVNERFQRFIENTYNSQFSLTGIRKPIVVSRILEHLKASPTKRKALIVIDGMNYWQWSLLGCALSSIGLEFSPNASLAFIPTITAWSRQAIFKGDKPDLEADNSKEKSLFYDFWMKNGLSSYQIDFKRIGVNDPFDISSIAEDIKILGMVCNDLDNIMHGAVLGDDQLKASTIQWIEKSKIVDIISELKRKGFHVFITSDHGNIEAYGLKNLTLKEKVGALGRSKRHLYFTNEILLNNFVEQNANVTIGKKGLSLYLKNKEAFTTENNKVITHGGSHIWEVIVPFISIDE
ncbi:BREX-3 system phosphatase PglZ [Adhaeribacter soli]|nr:BREX-3 system phosphatase PglZ [Adhaeribacter soli]